nr:MAG TPA: hypothetical protein [Caudoviricetes sp.]
MLKSLLSLLLSLFYSKSESAKVASQSLPNELDFTSVTLNTSQPDTFAAPYDGYLCIVVDTGGSINVWGDGLQSSNYSLNNGQSKLFVPMRKGNIIGYSISGRLLFGKFYRLVGGGYSAIEKLIRSGGALCLSNLYNSLRRSSLLTKRNGSVVMPFLLSRLQFLHEVQLHYQVTQQYHLLSRLTTAIYLHKFLPKAQTLKAYGLNTRVCDCGKVRLKEHGLEELFLSRKGLHSRSHSGTRAYKIPTSQLLSFTRASVVKTNFSVGGASC